MVLLPEGTGALFIGAPPEYPVGDRLTGQVQQGVIYFGRILTEKGPV